VSGQQHAPTALYPRERPGSHFTGGWEGRRAGLDGRKISSPPGFDPRPSSPSSVVISTELPGPHYIYIYVCVCMYVYMCIYIYIYIYINTHIQFSLFPPLYSCFKFHYRANKFLCSIYSVHDVLVIAIHLVLMCTYSVTQTHTHTHTHAVRISILRPQTPKKFWGNMG